MSVLASSCADTRGAQEPTAALERHAWHGVRSPLVLVTMDGARWQDVFEPHGRDPLPNMRRLAQTRGAFVGAPGRGRIDASGPEYISLPGYNEILSGRPPRACQTNDCPRATAHTLLDEAWASGAEVAAFASWEKLDRAITSSPGKFLVSCGRDGDPTIDPYPGSGDFRPDAITGYLAVSHLWRSQPDVLFVGLGEPDEYAHRGDREGYESALRLDDEIVGQIFHVLDQMGERGAQTTVVVTADHGRADDFNGHGGWAPESARVWLFASGPTFDARGRVASLEPRHLADIAPTLRIVLGLDADRSAVAGRPMTELFGIPRPPTQLSDARHIEEGARVTHP
ncbi:MAG TPA: alkaline phosphatase family protein [Labilithrix sp.]